MNISAIILAAGSSQRFGSAKMHHIMPNGKTLLECTLGIYDNVFEELYVVVPQTDATLFERVEQLGHSAVICQQAELGLSESIRAGLRALSSPDACLIGLGDMPYVSRRTVEKMVAAMRVGKILAPFSGHMEDVGGPTNKKMGNPVIFDHCFFETLLQVDGDQGGRQVINANLESVELLAVNDIGIYRDIDRRGDEFV